MGGNIMKERFEIYDGSAEAKKAKGKSKNLSGFHPLFTASARRSIALDGLKIWLLLGFVVGVVAGAATGAGAVSVLLGLLIAAVIYFGFRDDVYKKVYGPEHDRGQLPLPEGMSWEEAVDRIRRGFANPDVEQVTDTADAVTFYSKKRGTYQLKNTANGLKMTILTKPSKSSKKEYLYRSKSNRMIINCFLGFLIGRFDQRQRIFDLCPSNSLCRMKKSLQTAINPVSTFGMVFV